MSAMPITATTMATANNFELEKLLYLRSVLCLALDFFVLLFFCTLVISRIIVSKQLKVNKLALICYIHIGMDKFKLLKNELQEMAKYGSAVAVLDWDEQTYMPTAGREFRGEVKALLTTDLHKRFTSNEFVRLVKELRYPVHFEKLNDSQKIIVRETWRDLEKALKIPSEFVEEFSKLATEAFGAWVDARQKSDFKIFMPYLQKIVDMKIQEAEMVGYKNSPYDALLDDFEPGMTAKKLDGIFEPLAKELSVLIKKVAGRAFPDLPKAAYPIEQQKDLNNEVVNALGYDLNAGRIDESAHPFTTGFHPTDVRITTRYDENDFWVSLGSTVHEAGHGMYEQGLPAKDYGTPLGEAASLGIHESQSRVWENQVGRSLEFCEFLLPLLKKHFKGINYSAKELHAWLNRVEPSFIRVESDETTYNLHIILRYEIERDLIEGRLTVKELPEVWNAKMHDLLGLKVNNDANGVLQDVHWSYGSIGYFPTYSLGNIYAAQLFNKVNKDIPSLQRDFSAGDFSPFLKWLRKNIHQQGGRYYPEELIKKITGENLNSEYLVKYLKQKNS
jgi:carboxypeptidase Taq